MLLAVASSRTGRIAFVRDPRLRLWVSALALPIAAFHDLLLAGDPLFSLRVSARYTELYVPGLRPEAPFTFLADAAGRWAGQPLLVVLAVVGAAVVLRAPRRWIGGALVLLVLGDLALLATLAGRAVYVSARYYEVADVGLLAAAAIGVGTIAGWLPSSGRAWRAGSSADVEREGSGPRNAPPSAGARRMAGSLSGAAIACGLVAGLALAWPVGVDRSAAARLALVRNAGADATAIEAVLRSLGPSGPPGASGQRGRTRRIRPRPPSSCRAS